MSIYYSTVTLFAILIAIIKTEKPTQNSCKYDKSVTDFPKETTDCVTTRMSNGYSCCYEQYATYKLCVKEKLSSTVTEDTIKNNLGEGAIVHCPKSSSIPNNCGIVGINEPTTLEHCSNITIPESYCCLVKHSGGNSCRRLDYYPSENDKNKELKEEITAYGEEFISVECSDRFKHYATTLLVLTLLFVVL